MSPANIILEKVTFNNKEEYDKLKEEAKTIFARHPFFAAVYIYENAKDKTQKEIIAHKHGKKTGGGINIFSILAESEISNLLNSCEVDEKTEHLAGFLRELIDNDWDFQKATLANDKTKKKLNKPFRTPKGPKKFGVYVRNDKGNVVLVRFGDSNMEIKRDDPERRRNFRSRHGCDNPGPKWKAKYWSCKFWSSKPVSELLASEKDSLCFDSLLDEEEFEKSLI